MEFELPKDFKELFELLNANDVRYLLIGGYAVGMYGYVRATNDIDILVSDDRDNVAQLIDALIQFGFAKSDLDDEFFMEKRSMLEMGIEPMKVQILNFADGIDFDEAYENRNQAQVENIFVSTINKQDLIKNKTATGRLKDLADIERLEKMN